MSELDKEAALVLAGQMWPEHRAVLMARSSRVHSQFGLTPGQKGIVILTAGEAPTVLAVAGSWSKLASDLRRARDVGRYALSGRAD